MGKTNYRLRGISPSRFLFKIIISPVNFTITMKKYIRIAVVLFVFGLAPTCFDCE